MTSDFEQHLADLRREFDAAFARPPAQKPQDLIELAFIAANGQRYAIRISELAGLEVNRKIVPVPAEVRGLLGLSAVEGQLVPVFELAALLGGGSRGATPRWIALHRGKELVGLAFDEFEGTRRVPVQALHAAAPSQEQSPLSRQTVELDLGLVNVLDVPSIVSGIAGSGKE